MPRRPLGLFHHRQLNSEKHEQTSLKDESQFYQDKLIRLGLLQDRKQSEKGSRASNRISAAFADTTKGFRSFSRASHKKGHFSSARPPSREDQLSGPPPRSTRGMSSMLDLDRTRNRRDRTFIGSECAVCEEPLEHTLRGERILQFSCNHVAHEACFFEFIREFEMQYCPTCNAPLRLDSSRGGNVLDIEKLSNIVHSAPYDGQPTSRSTQSTPTPWDSMALQENSSRDLLERPPLRDRQSQGTQGSGDDLSRIVGRQSERNSGRVDTVGSMSQHARNNSATTGVASSADYAEPQNPTGRRHDYDVHSMETSLSPRGRIQNPIPAPTVTVRSEFPTLSRSKQQQSLTCLITVEVLEGKWRPNPEDFRGGAHPLASSSRTADNFSVRSPKRRRALESIHESTAALAELTEELHSRVDNWHGLDFSRFGQLRLHGHVRVGKDRQSWQELECYLFTEMLICVKEKKPQVPQQWDGGEQASQRKAKCTLKGSILIKKHLKRIETNPEELVLTLSLTVAELPAFHLQLPDRNTFETWKRALLDVNNPEPVLRQTESELDYSGTEDEDYNSNRPRPRRTGSLSSYAGRTNNTAPTEYSNGSRNGAMPPSMHVPLDIVVVIPVSSSMQGLKISLLRDTLRFLVSNLGERDRMGLVTFGSSGGGVPLVGMTSKTWNGWSKILDSIRPVGQKSLRADVVEGANVAMDLLMQRKSTNPLSSILLISDSSTSDPESVDFVISRAEAAKVVIHSFGLGLTHKPDTMIELSTRTKASYTYVKDWYYLRECVAGCLGSLQTISHQNVKLKLRLPEGSPAKFLKISGALQITKRATGRDAEAALGDLRFGDKRDILVQLAIAPDASNDSPPQDPWESIVSGLEALGPLDAEDGRTLSVEEVPLIQADLTYGDVLREGQVSQLPRPSLLPITLLPAPRRSSPNARPPTPPIPPHPSVVQRRMELLTSDMLTRALTLVSKGQHERAHHLLSETRSILKGLAKGGLPPLPPSTPLPRTPGPASAKSINGESESGNRERTPSPRPENPFNPHSGIDGAVMSALDAELESALEWINHPAVFGRDSRKAVLQAIGVISSQRGYTFRTPSESLWADRIAGIKRLSERARQWREAADESLMEEA